MSNPNIIIKSFKYDSEKRPQVHAWVLSLESAGKDFSESVRRLIEGDVEKAEKQDAFREQMQKDILSLKQMLSRLMVSGVAAAAGGGVNFAGSGNVDFGNSVSLSPEQMGELLEIEETVAAMEEQPEIKSVDVKALKNRYKLGG